jgi:amidase
MFRERVDRWFGDADLWLTPTVAVEPPRVGTWRDCTPEALFQGAAPLGAFTAVFNASGNPGTSVPVWPSDGGLPVGVQLVAPRGQDVRALAVARALLEALGTPLSPLAPE